MASASCVFHLVTYANTAVTNSVHVNSRPMRNRKARKYDKLRWPMHLPVHGQWWSSCTSQRHAAQRELRCWEQGAGSAPRSEAAGAPQARTRRTRSSARPGGRGTRCSALARGRRGRVRGEEPACTARYPWLGTCALGCAVIRGYAPQSTSPDPCAGCGGGSSRFGMMPGSVHAVNEKVTSVVTSSAKLSPNTTTWTAKALQKACSARQAHQCTGAGAASLTHTFHRKSTLGMVMRAYV